MEAKHVGVHTGGNDRDRGAGCRCWDAWREALCWATSSKEEELVGWDEAREAFRQWHAAQCPQTAAGNEGLDGLHSRDEGQEAQVSYGGSG